MESNATKPLINQLRSKTKELHQKSHHLPFFEALFKKQIQQESYVALLKALAIVYSVLERQIHVVNDNSINSLLSHYKSKRPYLNQDLSHFDQQTYQDYYPSVSSALNLADKVLLRKEQEPKSLIGFIYVLEGSTNGGSIFSAKISEALNLRENKGLSYFTCYGDQVKQNWQQFLTNLDQLKFEDKIAEQVIETAVEAFEGIIDIYNAIYPIDSEKNIFHITTINPEAGNHPIPNDAVEIESAIIAGERCWNKYPYYEKRFGERGRRFAFSDCAWLVSLCDCDEAGVIKQIQWLARYLAIRGMPTIMMEDQLVMLFEELIKNKPENKPNYQKLMNSALVLEQQRQQYISNEDFQAIAAEFNQQLSSNQDFLNATGELLVSAVVDEQSGVAEACSNLEQWLTDPALFSEPWIAAVTQTIQTAKTKMKI